MLEALGHATTAPLIFEVIPAFEAPDATTLEDLEESVRRWREAVADFEITRELNSTTSAKDTGEPVRIRFPDILGGRLTRIVSA